MAGARSLLVPKPATSSSSEQVVRVLAPGELQVDFDDVMTEPQLSATISSLGGGDGVPTLVRADVLSDLLETICTSIEQVVELVEDATEDDPLLLDRSALAASNSTVLYCADQLSRVEETLKSLGQPSRKNSATEWGLLLESRNSGGGLGHRNHSHNDSRRGFGSGRPKRAQSVNTALYNKIKKLTKGMDGANPHASILSTYSLDSMVWDGSRKVKRERFTKRIIHWMALASFVWQIMCVTLLMILGFILNRDHDQQDSSALWVQVTLIVMVVLQSIQIVGMICVMYKIGMQIAHHTISLETLVQSYVSTVLGMGGIYFLFMAMDSSSFDGLNNKWKGEVPEHVILAKPGDQWALFLHLVYFSSTTMTGTGYGDISPRTWFAVMFVIMQQLMAVSYSTVIFGLALQHFTSRLHVRRRALAAKQIRDEAIREAGGGSKRTSSRFASHTPSQNEDGEFSS
ncbi:hypothetical protein DIPPA_03668 [Diplonema papillatum]|nr:hypothetical protein DIPPA_03668 [Diplonema papillatum]|eukprot:gene10842-16680_t